MEVRIIYLFFQGELDMDKVTATIHTHPYILIFGGLPKEDNDCNADTARQYHVVVNSTAFAGLPCLVQALKLLLIVFFNFNYTYPNTCAHFLEFIQRCFMEIYPTEGTRSNQATVKKAQTFMKKIQSIEVEEIA